MTTNDILKIISLWPGDIPDEKTREKIEKSTGSVFSDQSYQLLKDTLTRQPDHRKWGYAEWRPLIAEPPVSYPNPVVTPKSKVYSWPDGTIRNEPVSLRFRNTNVDNLSDQDKDTIKNIYENGLSPKGDKLETYDERLNCVMAEFGIQKRAAQYWISGLGLKKTPPPKDVKTTDLTASKSRSTEGRFHIFTSAQNATAVNQDVWKSILRHRDLLDSIGGCSLHVIPFRYKNPTSNFQDKEQDWWDERVVPHLDTTRHEIESDLVVLGDVKTQPTATWPLENTQVLSGSASCILAHPKMQMHPLPVLEGEHLKMGYTTGACTHANYTDSIAGKKGEFHHQFGFVVVERATDGEVFTRQVRLTSRGIGTDLIYAITPNGVTEVSECTSLVLGDIHVGDHDPVAIKAAVKFAEKVKPRYTVLHDVFNGHSVNHHEAKNPFKKFENELAGRTLLQEEINEMNDFLSKFKQEILGTQFVVVRSNHDDFLDRYLRTEDWKADVRNARAYMNLSLAIMNGDAPNGCIPYAINREHPDITCLGLDESFKPGKFELAHHGHLGNNGSKGSPKAYSLLPSKSITGHTHAPGSYHGCMVVGTSTKLRVGYNTGASAWRQAHVVEHLDGSAQHILLGPTGNFTTLF